MILCSHFLWFCDVESVTNRDLTPNHSLVGGSGTAHCATPVLVNLQKIQDERNESFQLPLHCPKSPCTDTLSSFPGVQPSCRAFPVHLTPSPCFEDRALHWSLAPNCRTRQDAGAQLGTTTVVWPLSSGRAGFHLCAVQSKIKKHTSHPVYNCWFNRTMSREKSPFNWFSIPEQSYKSQ